MSLIKSHTDLISVVIPTKNRSQRLAKAIASAQQQLGVDLEILVIDDASTDATESVVKSIASNDPRVFYFRHLESCGAGAARNTGIENAHGPLVAFLDDDDVWLSDKLQLQLALLKTKFSAVAVSCSFVLSKTDQTEQLITIAPPVDRQQLLRSNHLGGSSVCLVWRQVLLTVGGFDPKLRSCQDWDLWLKLHNQGQILVHNTPLVKYFVHNEERITGNKKNEYQGRKKIYFRYRIEMTKKTRKHSLAVLSFYRIVLSDRSCLHHLKKIISLVVKNRSLESFKFLIRMCKLIVLKK
jgi:glycosyltransferase involved in cell wall biosynthesis